MGGLLAQFLGVDAVTTCAHYRIRACEVCAACLLPAEGERAACLLTAEVERAACLPPAEVGCAACLLTLGGYRGGDAHARFALALRSLCARSALRALRAARARHRAGVFGIAEDPSCHAGTVVKWEFWHRQNSLMPFWHSSNNNLNHLEIRLL